MIVRKQADERPYRRQVTDVSVCALVGMGSQRH